MNDESSVANALVLSFYICVALFAVYWGYAALSKPMKPPRPLCGVAEISPDFSQEQREQCRQMRRHAL